MSTFRSVFDLVLQSERRWVPAVALLGLIAFASAQTASAQGTVVIYRCTDASGALTIQNGTPCPKGSKQERRVMEAAPAALAPTSVPSPSAAPPVRPAPRAMVSALPPAAVPAEPPIAPAPETTIADSDRLPPPWLYECRTYNDDTYFSEVGAPAPRCVTLNPTGLSGVIESNNVSACEMKTDQCQRVPDGALCDSWRRRLREVQSALQFGAPENRAEADAEVQRVMRVVRDSTCGKQ
ncbi:DUF4124 domain-containing protein [Lysobacter sp. Root494]|uniref:DUF4124 domain-containing protein n=1 Tax=Lysobacter sp. Root494 TaxID=1736549 RepID=UPI0006F3ED01|nr:DUF4124 domain-containing protein [Lysobacter sp. Root494]KQY54856.1 hypothetical protein ASD14_01390 [Lysobacter sp. Root494]